MLQGLTNLLKETSYLVVKFEDSLTQSIFDRAYRGKNHVYVLRLYEKKFYVGYSADLKERLSRHFSNEGAAYTKMFTPITVMNIIEGGDEQVEEEVTLEMMKLYGRKNVRGSH